MNSESMFLEYKNQTLAYEMSSFGHSDHTDGHRDYHRDYSEYDGSSEHSDQHQDY